MSFIHIAHIYITRRIFLFFYKCSNKYFLFLLGDDEGGIPMGNVVRSVEDALSAYDIDTRTCLARTMCNQYQTKLEDEERSTAARISRGILDNLAG